MAGDANPMITLTADSTDADRKETSAARAEGSKFAITDNRDVGIYEARLDGVTVAGVVYSSHITLLATSVFPEFRGKGIAGELLAGVLDRFRAQGETVTITCPFAARFISAHPDYADVIDAATPRTPRRRH